MGETEANLGNIRGPEKPPAAAPRGLASAISAAQALPDGGGSWHHRRMERAPVGRLATWVVVLVLGSTQPAWSWISVVEDPWPSAGGISVVLDGAGDVIAGGTTPGQEVIKLDGTSGAVLWAVPSIDGPATLDVDAAGDVVAAGRATFSGGYGVAKLDGATGAESWRSVLSGGAGGVAFDSVGDVVSCGSHSKDFTVIKHAGATGVDLWSVAIAGTDASGSNGASAVAVDGADDIVAVGSLENLGTLDDLVAVKLDGATGAELWRREVDVPVVGEISSELVIDGAGDVIAAATIAPWQAAYITKLDGTTGADVWALASVPSLRSARAVALDGAGDVVVAGATHNGTSLDLAVLKFDSSTGAELWRRSIDGTEAVLDEATDVSVDAAGDVIVTGGIRNDVTGHAFSVVKLDGSTGAEIWRQELDGDTKDTSSYEAVIAVALTASGDAVVTGVLENEATEGDAVIARIDGARGGLGARAGQILVLRDPGDPSKRNLRFLIKDDFVTTPSPGSVNDPATAGATIRLVNPTTLEEAVFVIPGGPEWKALGKPAGAKGYKYKAPAGLGPCRSIVVNPRKKAKVVCSAKHGAIPFDLDEASQGSLSVSLRLGTGGAQCATFGGLLIQDEPGSFKAKKSPAGSACP